MAFLNNQAFTEVIDRTPLVSIDLVVENEKGEILFGLRTNRPAQGYWFVPGGRILKDETLNEAFLRLTSNELGVEISRSDACLLDIYEHFYDDSFWDEKISTHYIVLAYRIKLRTRFLEKLDKQHDLFEWLSIDELLSRSDVHKNVKAYFS